MTKSERYFFDLDAIRDKHAQIDSRGYKRIKYEGKGNPNNFSGDVDFLGQNPNGKNPGDVSDFWDIPTKPSTSEHYASYNDELIRKPILAGCPEGGIVYDPFMGTGSTAEVCLRSKRLYIGSEMSENYVKIAEKRLEPFLMQQTLF
jgi:DNA modification methylase